MASRKARELAAQAWCGEKTSGTVMDVDLGEEFAEILDQVWGDLCRIHSVHKLSCSVPCSSDMRPAIETLVVVDAEGGTQVLCPYDDPGDGCSWSGKICGYSMRAVDEPIT